MESDALTKIDTLKSIHVICDMANGRFVQATKTSLYILGICKKSYAMPLLPFNDEERSLIENIVGEIKAMGKPTKVL